MTNVVGIKGAKSPPSGTTDTTATTRAKDERTTRWCYCQKTSYSPLQDETMVACDGGCDQWYHLDCLRLFAGLLVDESSLSRLASFTCPECKASSTTTSDLPRKRKRQSPGFYQQVEDGLGPDRIQFNYHHLYHTTASTIKPHRFPVVYSGSGLTLKWAYDAPSSVIPPSETLSFASTSENSVQTLSSPSIPLKPGPKGFHEPVIVLVNEGLAMRMPPPTITVQEIAEIVGLDHQVDVMDVDSQLNITMTLGQWAAYFHTPAEKRRRILNVISLEISHTPLMKQITRPRLVRQLDWAINVWPSLEPTKPKVSCYCLMSVADCYTDFHIDMGGTSVFYHVLSGQKIFYFAPPTKYNMAQFRSWSTSAKQQTTFFGNLVPNCVQAMVYPGNTMFIPTGWIHAVYTPRDSVVIGGNFLHSLNAPLQLDIHRLENELGVEDTFRYPLFDRMQWYVAFHTVQQVQKGRPNLLLECGGFYPLVSYLQSLLMEDGKSGASKKRAHKKALNKRVRQSIPSAVITDVYAFLQTCLRLADIEREMT